MAIVNGELGWPGYYLSAYGIAQKQGYPGTEEEWLDSLKGADVELRYQDGLLQWKHDEAEDWNTLDGFTVFQADIVKKADNAQRAADRANASAGKADKASAAATTAAATANTQAGAAREAAEGANAASSQAHTARENADTAAGLANEKAGLAQTAAGEAREAKAQADTAAAAANSAAAGASASKTAADSAAQQAETKAGVAQEGANAANTAAAAANSAATAANGAASSATAAAQEARTQAGYAKGQGEAAKELLGKIEETDVGGMAADILALQSGKAEKTAVENALAAKADQTAVTSALAEKVDKADGMGLSANSYTTAEKEKLAGVEEGANRTLVENSLIGNSIRPVTSGAVTAALSTFFTVINNHGENKENPHGVTYSQVGAASSGHTHSDKLSLSGGTMTGQLKAQSNTSETAQVRNIQLSTTDLTAGTSSLPSGTLYFVYE